jgi:hypothetical protein
MSSLTMTGMERRLMAAKRREDVRESPASTKVKSEEE